ncbi:MAG: GNAT family N-acetyltransferase [Oscillospiraceae bacterium]
MPELYARSAARHAQEHPGSVVRVLSGDRVVGLVELDPGRDEQSGCGWISLLYMLPEYRGRGWAIQLLGYAFWFYENHDRTAVRLHVSENNAGPSHSTGAAALCRSGATPVCARICCSWAGSSTGR